MKTVRTAAELRGAVRRASLAIGVFDGVHLGHQQVIRQTIADARAHHGQAVVVTFDRHPAAIVAPDRTPPLLYSLPQKLRTIEGLGADAAIVLTFDTAFSRQPAEEFIRGLHAGLGPLISICVGAGFVFGQGRGGNVALLARLGAALGFQVHGLAAVALDGEPVSSTRVREALRAGDFDRASQMLGREYALAGTVVRGDGLGRQLGFPTANLDVSGLLVPPAGVYAAHVLRHGGRLPAAVNIGVRPTLHPSASLHVEAHLLDFDGDLYGEELEVCFLARLRDERRFPSREALMAQLAADVAATRAVLD